RPAFSTPGTLKKSPAVHKGRGALLFPFPENPSRLPLGPPRPRRTSWRVENHSPTSNEGASHVYGFGSFVRDGTGTAGAHARRAELRPAAGGFGGAGSTGRPE